LQEEHNKRLVYRVLPNMVFAGNFREFRHAAIQRRNHNLKSLVLESLRIALDQKNLRSQIISTYRKRNLFNLFHCLRREVIQRQTYRNAIEHQIFCQELQEHHQIMRKVFDCFIKFRFQCKAKKEV